MQNKHIDNDDDFEILPNGKKVLKDHRVYRTKMVAMDADGLSKRDRRIIARLEARDANLAATVDADARRAARRDARNARRDADRAAARDAMRDRRITDGTGDDSGLWHRSGWRLGDASDSRFLTTDAEAERAVDDAHRAYLEDLTTAWVGDKKKKKMSTTEGMKEQPWKEELPDDDEDSDNDDDSATSDAVRPPRPPAAVDAAAVQRQINEHSERMSALYDALDKSISEKWRGGNNE
jgi:hypothetical protein